jgi:MFS family permease
MGVWLDRAGIRGPAITAAVMIGLGAIFTSWISSEWQLYVIYGLMMGLFGRGALNVPLMANIAGWFGRRRGMAVGFVFSGQALGGALWPMIFQHFNQSIGWRATAFWYGVLAIATMLPLSLVIRNRPPQPAKGADSGGKVAAGSARTTARPLSPGALQASLCCAIVGCCIAMSLPLAHIVAHVSDLGHSSARGAEMLSVILLSSALSSLFGVGFMAERHGGLRTLFVFSLVQMVTLVVLSGASGLAALYASAALFGLGYGGILPSYPIIVREHLPARQAGRRTGIVLLFSGVGMAIGGWMGGLIFDISGSYVPAFLLGAAFNLGNLALVGVLIRRTRQRVPLPAAP